MYKNKNVLLIAGGGTLGTYTAKELLKLGCNVDIICPEEKVSHDERLTFYQSLATEELLKDLFSKKHYHGIVNFIHYKKPDDYKLVHHLLAENTDHLIFLSSYRVYADMEHPITENSPRLLDVSTDERFLAEEDYAVSKAKAEDYIRAQEPKNWTFVRPVISFSQRRLDIVTTSRRIVLESAREGKTIYLPEIAKNITAGLDWSGNTGKIIANLLFKKEAFGEAFTISSAPNLTWGEVAELYTQLLGTKFEWVDTEKWMANPDYPKTHPCMWAEKYDRFFDRAVDTSKVMKVTGLKPEDFLSIKEGLIIEIGKILEEMHGGM